MTTDLRDKTVEELREHADMLGDYITPRDAFDELARRLDEAQQKIVAQEAKDNYVGRWLSAALDDPSVCEGMKADIRLWMASDAVALAAHDAKVAAEAKAEAMAEAANLCSEWATCGGAGHYGGYGYAASLRKKAAEYRAKAAEAGRKE